jgi:hypothetical protein
VRDTIRRVWVSDDLVLQFEARAGYGVSLSQQLRARLDDLSLEELREFERFLQSERMMMSIHDDMALKRELATEAGAEAFVGRPLDGEFVLQNPDLSGVRAVATHLMRQVEVAPVRWRLDVYFDLAGYVADRIDEATPSRVRRIIAKAAALFRASPRPASFR